MSEDLKSFIQRYKRRNENPDKLEDTRKKRSQDLDENLLYVIQNGQLVPFRNIKESKRSEELNMEQEGYTVVPLIIPLNMRAPGVKLIKTRTLSEEMEKPLAKDEKSGASVAPVSAIGSSTAASVGSDKGAEGASGTPPTALEEEGSDNNTKEETQVLHRILEDVEGLMQWKHEGNKKEGVLCNLNGSWISDAAGMRFDICYKNSTRKKFRIHVADRIPPNEDGFLCDGNWTVFGELPFLHSGMVIALAVHEKDKHIATFIGECRTCEGSETVTGTWLIGRSSRDCKDQKAAHKVLSDVWKREQGHTLRKKHLEQIGYSMKDDDD
ncbi:uncharacterized protein LOC135143046 isoform X2 [Zophobas morio]